MSHSGLQHVRMEVLPKIIKLFTKHRHVNIFILCVLSPWGHSIPTSPKAQLKSPLPRLCKTSPLSHIHRPASAQRDLLTWWTARRGWWGGGLVAVRMHLIDYPLWRVEEGTDKATRTHSHTSLLRPSAWGLTSQKSSPPKPPPASHTALSIFSNSRPLALGDLA